MSCTPEEIKQLDDQWFYQELSTLGPEGTLDMTQWYHRDVGPRWRGLRESVWTAGSDGTEWRRLLRRLPHYFGSEVAYLNNRILEIARRMLPHFDTILADHAYHEWLLYAEFDNEKYRDHIVHPFKTAVLAHWLLRETRKISIVQENLQRSDYIKRLLRHWGLHPGVFDEHGKKIIEASLWLAGLFHDLGYGHFFACQIHQRLVRSYRFCPVDIVGGSVAGMKAELIERSLILRHLVDDEPLKAFLACGDWGKPGQPTCMEKWKVTLFENFKANHSIAGGLNLLCLLQEIIDFWPSVDPCLALVFELAAEAVFLHDLTTQFKFSRPASGLAPRTTEVSGASCSSQAHITFENCPIAVILILADELQCWGRPRLTYRPGLMGDEIIVKYEAPVKGLRYRRLDEDGALMALEIDEEIFQELDQLAHPEGSVRSVDWEGFLHIRSLFTGEGAGDLSKPVAQIA